MKLRNLPLAVSNWPPTWTLISPTTNDWNPPKKLTGEVGLLKEVILWNGRETRCFLFVEYDHAIYLGCLVLEDRNLSQAINELLRGYRGQPIKVIGDLDVSYLS